MKLFLLSLLLFTIGSLPSFGQTPTEIVVRIKAKDAKFIGTSMGGANIIISNAQSGVILAHGITQGSTGNTSLIMKEPSRRGVPIYDDKSAFFKATINIEKPIKVKISAVGPTAQIQSQVTSSTEIWLLPGKHLNQDGILLELPGFAVDIILPAAHSPNYINKEMAIQANIVMMCGCTLSDGGLWDANKMEIEALIYLNGTYIESKKLNLISNNTFQTTYLPSKSGVYEIIVTSYDPQTNNTGVDKTTTIVN